MAGGWRMFGLIGEGYRHRPMRALEAGLNGGIGSTLEAERLLSTGSLSAQRRRSGPGVAGPAFRRTPDHANAPAIGQPIPQAAVPEGSGEQQALPTRNT